jgi:hypothetical protein
MSKTPQIKIPLNLISETPERWVIIKIPNETEIIYKVFATWAGGYLGSDRWKLNSGIVRVEEDEEYFYFFGYSGSCYKCRKGAYGFMTSYGSGILDGIIKQASETGVDIETMLEDTDWKILINQNKDEKD